MNVIKPSARRVVALAAALASPLAPSWGCTLWGAAGSEVDGGGTLVAKNRDWLPDNHQVLKTVAATAKHLAYFGLYAEDNDAPGFKAGLNEKGLVVVNASASAVPEALRLRVAHRSNLVRTLLETYATVADAVADLRVFEGKGAMFYLLGDATTVATVEVSVDGRASVKTTTSGTLAHTNHYLDPAFAAWNVQSHRSSEVRLGRISALLSSPGPFTFDTFWALTLDRHDGPHDSLWRTGTGPGERTLASWAVAEAPGRAPVVRVRLANPGEPVTEQTFVADGAFWARAHG
jgi:isopenicillin-N N-acyltransferase-like protein